MNTLTLILGIIIATCSLTLMAVTILIDNWKKASAPSILILSLAGFWVGSGIATASLI